MKYNTQLRKIAENYDSLELFNYYTGSYRVTVDGFFYEKQLNGENLGLLTFNNNIFLIDWIEGDPLESFYKSSLIFRIIAPSKNALKDFKKNYLGGSFTQYWQTATKTDSAPVQYSNNDTFGVFVKKFLKRINNIL